MARSMDGSTDFCNQIKASDSQGKSDRQSQVMANVQPDRSGKPVLNPVMNLGKNKDGYDILPSK